MKVVKEGRIWWGKLKNRERVDKILVDLPADIINNYRVFAAEIVSPHGTLRREGVVWDGKTAEVYVPSHFAKKLTGEKVIAEILADNQLKIRFEVV